MVLFTFDYFKELIENNLYHIAIITEDEYKQLDDKQFQLKKTMPAGWKPGDSVKARIVVYNNQRGSNPSINLIPINNTTGCACDANNTYLGNFIIK